MKARTPAGWVRRVVAVGSVAALMVVGLGGVAAAQPAATDTLPAAVQVTPPTVTADALPSWQINGVIWSQAIIGDIVYVTGSFTKARPPGVAAGGTGEVAANNIFAYRLSTGDRVASFAPSLNAQGLVIRASADGSRLWVGGDFTTVNGVARGHLAALNPANGSLISGNGFVPPNVGGQVRGLGITPNTIYVGGNFSSANGVARTRLAAFSVTNGAMTSWAPVAAGGYVWAMTMSPDQSRVIPAGSFTTLNGQAAYGMGSVMANDGTVINPWPAQEKIRVAGANGAITSVKADSTQIYGTSYAFGAGASYEGTFAIDPMTGQINWANDCLGDTYDNAPAGDVLYVASHQHDCTVVGGWPDTNPRVRWQKAAAQYSHATDISTKNDAYGWGATYGLIGLPYAKTLPWYPNFAFGSYTSAGQAAWAVDASPDGQWVVYGGEFPRVNGVAQQGIVRFRTRDGAPNKSGPTYSTIPATPVPTTNAVSLSSGTARVSWGSAWDMDDPTLTYDVLRDNNTWVYSTTGDSNFWTLPKMGFIDKDLPVGSTHKYQIRITDPSGNILWSPVSNTVTISGGSPSAYASTVNADGAQHFWRLGESSGSTALDWAGFDDDTLYGGYTRGQAGAITNDGDASTSFDGTSGYAVNSSAVPGPNVFSIEAWFKTTSTTGGKIVSFGDQPTGMSNNYDRHVYMDPQGRVWFGVFNNGAYTVNTTASLNDGQWHHVVGTMDATGPTLFVDGKKIGHNGGTSAAQPYNGYWRIGGDSAWNGNPFFNGTIDDVAIYPTALKLSTVQQHYVASGRSLNIPTRPTDSYGGAIWDSTPDLYWRLGEASGSAAADSSPNDMPGVYRGGVTYGVPGALPNNPNTAVTLNGSWDQGISSANPVTNPTVYSEELWFKTTTTSGGKLIGFGSDFSGNSGGYDRHVYMFNDGRLRFGVWTGFTNVIDTPLAYNDGSWHHMVATQGPDGMKLYVDAQLVGTNGQTQAQAYDGYWRVGGDSTWGGASSDWFAGSIDEVAVYSSVLSPTTVQQHFQAGGGQLPNQLPAASFTHSESGLTMTVDGSGSSDPDGSIVSYSWNWGDGSPAGSGATASHAYAGSGSYSVTLTVTDDRGGSATTTSSVTVTAPPPNQLPTASFTHAETGLSTTVNGSGSSDPDGSIASYAWDFGDGSTGTGVTPVAHVYAVPGTYTVSLTVTDNQGATSTTSDSITVDLPPNQAPTASFTHAESGLSTSLDGSGSADPDGSIVSYSWNWGDGSPEGSAATATHTYAASGTYTVTLTVTDNAGGTGTASASVTVTAPPPNQVPTASFTHAETGLSTTVNGSGSSDPDGSIASYAWDFGDNSTGTGVTPAAHVYAQPGTYTVSLTVTDNQGATGTATAVVTVTAPPVDPAYAKDAFGRTVANGWGTADLGGSWIVSGAVSKWSVGNGVGSVNLAAGGSATASLPGVSKTDTEIAGALSTSKAATGSGQYLSVIARQVNSTTDYRGKVQFRSDGKVYVALTRMVGGSETTLPGAVVLPGVTMAANDKLQIRVQAVGSSPTTLRLKAWKDGTAEPAAWTITTTDSTAGLQVAGAAGFYFYLSSGATNPPTSFSLDDLSVGPSRP